VAERTEAGGEAIVAGALSVASAAVVGSLFLEWYRLGGGRFLVVFGSVTLTGWRIFSYTDLALAGIAALGLALAVLLATGARLSTGVLAAGSAVAAGGLALAVVRAGHPPAVLAPADLGPAVGAYVAIGGLASMAVALLLAALWR
jgi:hypothetical protein